MTTKKITHDQMMNETRHAYEQGLLDRAKAEEIAQRRLIAHSLKKGFWERLMDLWERNSDRRHEWRMANHKLHEQNTAHIHYDEIGISKTMVILFAEMILFIAVYGVIMIAKWLIWKGWIL